MWNSSIERNTGKSIQNQADLNKFWIKTITRKIPVWKKENSISESIKVSPNP